VEFGGTLIAETTRARRVLETSHPPVYYIPRDDTQIDLLELSPQRSFCEFKGSACYWTIRVSSRRSEHAAWSYPNPLPPYEELRDHLAFYASRVDACFVDDEQVTAQEGDFYGGWITHEVVGPFKGAPGTGGW
jgi:uncharacterized protein (DUF427 family)